MNIAQIVTFWLGPRRVVNPQYVIDNLYYVKKQLQAIDCCRSSIKDYYFVFNCPISHEELIKLENRQPLTLEQRPDYRQACQLISDHAQGKDYHVKAIARPNLDGSYGGWNHALQEIKGKYDYSILLEDDYMPFTDDYDLKFVEFFNNLEDVPPRPWEGIDKLELGPTAYVCQLYRFDHCSMACGMIDNKIFDKIGSFLLNSCGHNYGYMEQNQVHFLDSFTKAGYIIRDIHRKYYIPFLSHRMSIYEYGVLDEDREEREALVVPIYPPFQPNEPARFELGNNLDYDYITPYTPNIKEWWLKSK